MKKGNVWMLMALIVAIIIFVWFFWKTIVFFLILGLIGYLAYRYYFGTKKEDG
jgi:uncharacterized membrane protein